MISDHSFPEKARGRGSYEETASQGDGASAA